MFTFTKHAAAKVVAISALFMALSKSNGNGSNYSLCAALRLRMDMDVEAGAAANAPIEDSEDEAEDEAHDEVRAWYNIPDEWGSNADNPGTLNLLQKVAHMRVQPVGVIANLVRCSRVPEYGDLSWRRQREEILRVIREDIDTTGDHDSDPE